MDIIKLVVGPLKTNCYILYSYVDDNIGKEGIVVDPGGDCGKIKKVISQYNIKIKLILNTHIHEDHTFCNNGFKRVFGCRVCVGKGSLTGKNKRIKEEYIFVGEGESIKIGKSSLKILETPGHCKGSLSLIEIKRKFIICGDLIFKDGVGRTDLAGGNVKSLISSIKRIMLFPNDFLILPGHGEPFTIGEWKYNNYNAFLKMSKDESILGF